MKFGFCLPTFSFPDLDFKTAGRIREFATRAEALGYLRGTPAQIRARIEELAAAGLEYIVLSPLDYDLAQLELWQAEIVRHFPD